MAKYWPLRKVATYLEVVVDKLVCRMLQRKQIPAFKVRATRRFSKTLNNWIEEKKEAVNNG